jgi:trk system potassium uptake protein TrkH
MMNHRLALVRPLAFLMALLAGILCVPLVMAVFCGETREIFAFGATAGGLLVITTPLLLIFRKKTISFRRADGFLLVFLGWVLICLASSVPFALSGCFKGFSEAFFESVSGWTTTGSSMLRNVEAAPRSVVFWRGLTHWFGGMGIVALTVAMLPALGVSAGSMLDAESPGPETDRIAPRFTRTAKILWGLYAGLTVILVILLRLGGMPWFDSVFNSFSTMGTGGFACTADSIASYHSPYIEWVITIFMLIAGFNFTLIYRIMQGRFREVGRNSEARAYLFIVVAATLTAALSIRFQGTGAAAVHRFGTALREAAFHVASVLTTTGYSVANQDLWPPLAQGVIFFLMFIGGCTGSTAGGVKILRHLILVKQAGNEMKRLVYPHGVFSIRLDGSVAKKEIVHGAAGFVLVYLAIVFVSFIVVAACGVGLFDALSTSLLCIGNIGLGFGGSDGILQSLPAGVKVYLAFVMLAGRLELWSMLVFFSRDYWRR